MGQKLTGSCVLAAAALAASLSIAAPGVAPIADEAAVPRLTLPGCPAGAAPDEAMCGEADRLALLDGVTVVAGADGIELIESRKVAAVFGPEGPSPMRAGDTVAAVSGRPDVTTTGSIGPR